MIPRPFDYERPASIGEAVELLGAACGAASRRGAVEREARVLAGGQSLVPMLSLGLARPDLLVDIGRLDLAGLEIVNGVVRVGALTRHRELELGRDARRLLPLAAEAATHVGNPRVRNRGTFGGSLAHADPAAELPVVALAHGGVAIAHGPGGARRVPLEEFFRGPLDTALERDELLVEVELERLPEGSGAAFEEVAQRADDFALACAAAVVTAAGETRIALGGVGGRPLRFDGVPDELPAAADDAFVSGAYRRRLALVCARRALARARQAAG